MPSTDHFDGRRFFNPIGPPLQPLTAVPRMLLARRTPWPSRISPRQAPERDGANAVVTFIGHATFLIQTAAGNVLTDPVYSEYAGPWGRFGPRRVQPPAIALDALPPISIVLLSHNHYDHCDLRTLKLLGQRFDPIAVTPLGNGRLLKSTGLRRVEEPDWWQKARTTALPITVTPAHHFSARGPFDRNRALWGGFLIDTNGRHIYFAGDTAYSPWFNEIRQHAGSIDLALLPIGAYEPRWFMKSVHMNPAEAVQAHLDLGATESIGMHFGTFQMAAEGIDEPLVALAKARAERHVPTSSIRTLGFGDSAYLR